MADATGEAKAPPLRVAFDRRLKLEFHGARITSDGGLLAYRELDEVLDLTTTGMSALAEGRRGTNIRHRLLGLLRQAIYGRHAGYEDVNDAERLAHDPVMRAIVGREGLDRPAASTSQMGRFETEWLATEANLDALTDLSGAWIDRVHGRRPPDGIVLDLDSSESPTYGEQEGGLERALPLHLLPPAVPLQPVRGSRALHAAPRQRPHGRGLALRACTGDRPVSAAGWS
jgi:hypothetical protein